MSGLKLCYYVIFYDIPIKKNPNKRPMSYKQA